MVAAGAVLKASPISSRTCLTVERSSARAIESTMPLSSFQRASASSGAVSTRFATTSADASSSTGTTEARASLGESRPWYVSILPSTRSTAPSSAPRTASNAGLSENTVQLNDPVLSPSSAFRYGLPFEAVLVANFLRTRMLAKGRPEGPSAALSSRTDERLEGDSGIFFDELRVGPEGGVLRRPQDRVEDGLRGQDVRAGAGEGVQADPGVGVAARPHAV